MTPRDHRVRNKQHATSNKQQATSNQQPTTKNQQPTTQAHQVCVACLCDVLLKPGGRHVGAWRPRTRRSVEAPAAPSLDALAAPAAALHRSRDVGPVTNSALRSQTTARAGVWGREMNYTAAIREPPHTKSLLHCSIESLCLHASLVHIECPTGSRTEPAIRFLRA